MKQKSLEMVKNNQLELNEEQKESLYDLLSKGTRQETRRKLMGRIEYIDVNAKLVPYAYADRITFTEDNKCEYTAGQDYPYEIRTIRNYLLK
jgi:hypothetical protein